MQSNNIILKIVIIVALIALVLFVIGFGLSALRPELEPVPSQGDVPVTTGSDLETISATSSVDSDMDAYLKASNNPSNPNDFNDSYSDLNQ
jgi:hypothetical protein